MIYNSFEGSLFGEETKGTLKHVARMPDKVKMPDKHGHEEKFSTDWHYPNLFCEMFSPSIHIDNLSHILRFLSKGIMKLPSFAALGNYS